MRSTTLKGWLWIHKWSSLVSTVFLLMLCLTGLPLIFADEIEHWLDPHPELTKIPAQVTPPSLDTIVQRALAQRVSEVPIALFLPEDDPDVVIVSTASSHSSEQSHYQAFDMRTGERIAAEQKKETGFMYVMERLHVDIFAGIPGKLLLGVMGVLMALAVVSGIVVYAPFMRKLPFATVRTARTTRVKWLDLHNLIGIVTLAWALVVSLTGTINAWVDPILWAWQRTELAEMIAPYKNTPPLQAPLASIDASIAIVKQAEPHMRVAGVIFPGGKLNGEHHYSVQLFGNTPLTSRILKPALVDAQTGSITEIRALPWYLQALFVSKPLHFGDYGGLPLKIVWALLTLITIVVLGSGLYLWLRKPNGAQAKVREPKGVVA